MTQDDEQRALEAANRLLNEIGVHHPEQVGIDQFLTDVHRVATIYVQYSKASKGAGDGWQLVPVEPTTNMIDHANTACIAANFSVQNYLLNTQAQERVLLAAAYRAMLAAAPKPPETKP